SPRAATVSCGTGAPTPVRASSTCICTCSAGAVSAGPPAEEHRTYAEVQVCYTPLSLSCMSFCACEAQDVRREGGQMAKLNQIIAVEKGIKARSFQELTEAHQVLQKPAALGGISRTYRPKDE